MLMRALAAFIALPGFISIVVPPVIAYFDPWKRGGAWAAGAVVMCLGLALLLLCVRDFYVSGKGTLAPWDPPKELVVGGPYRFMRNPMYAGVLLLVLGWSALYLSPLLLAYAVALGAGFHLRVVRNEEPWLKARFGDRWESYRAHVPRWLPRVTPWNG